MTGILWCGSCNFFLEQKVICLEAVDSFEWLWVRQSFGTGAEDVYYCVSCEYSLPQKQPLFSNNYFKILCKMTPYLASSLLNFCLAWRERYQTTSYDWYSKNSEHSSESWERAKWSKFTHSQIHLTIKHS